MLTIITTSVVVVIYLQNTMYEQVRSQTMLLKHMLEETPEDNFTILYDVEGLTQGRVTYIYHNGMVTYDSDYDYRTIENYANKPEVRDALYYGMGIEKRIDDITGRMTYYCAVKVGTDSVVRIAITTRDAFQDIVIDAMPMILAAVLVIIWICFIVSAKTSQKIVDGIENYDIEKDEGEIYEELFPFINKIRRQNIIINKQLQSLTDEKTKLQSIFENIKESIIVCDSKLNIIQTNPEAMELIGFDKINIPLKSVMHTKNIIDVVRKAVEGRVSQDVFRLGDKWFQCVASPNNLDGDNGAVLIVMDITDQIERERQRRQFTDNVTHELKTPLTSILGYSQLITNNMAKPEDIQSFAQVIENNAAVLLTMIDDIIRISNLEAGDNFVKTPFYLDEVLLQTVKQQHPSARRRNIDVTVEIEPVEIMADEGQIYQLAHNLISNAIKYNKEGGTVKVSLKKEGENAVFVVADTGIGIDSEYLDKIFERFFVVDKSRNKNISSSGLGLSIVKHIVKSHGGAINVKSAPGQGTEFTIKLPLS